MAPIISAECAVSIGSRKIRWMSAALLARSDAAMPAVVNASALTRNNRAAVVGGVTIDDGARGGRSDWLAMKMSDSCYVHHASTGGSVRITRLRRSTAARSPSSTDASASSCSMLIT